jgi:acetyltransferase EpsM
MAEAFQVVIPLINANEPEALVAALHVAEGLYVDAGQLIAVLETTKAIQEVMADQAGFVVGLRGEAGKPIRAGDTLCWLAVDPDWRPPQTSDHQVQERGGEAPSGLRITRPALALAQAHGLTLENLPVDRLLTEADIERLLAGGGEVEAPVDEQALFVYGGGGHGKSVIDLVRAVGRFRLVGVVDDGLSADRAVLGVALLGGHEQLRELYRRGVRQAANAVGGIGDIHSRVRVFERIVQAGFACPALIHPSAVVEPSAQVSDAVQIFPSAYVGSEARIGFGSIVNTSAVVSHDCRLGDYANIAPGALLAGGVSLGERVLVGMGATLNLGVSVGAGARIGNGAVVKQSVPEAGVVRAGAVWP